MRSNIRLSLFTLLPVQLLALLDNVIAKLTGNTYFTALPISLADLGKLRDELQAAIEGATGGSLQAKKLRDQKVAEVRDALRVTADHQRAVSNGDPVKLSTGGFELAKAPAPINEVGIPGKVIAAATDASGEVLLRWGRTIGARMFRVEQALSDPTADETSWTTVALVGRQRCVVKGLESYKARWFRITALGVDSEGLPSDIVLGRAV